MDSTNLRCVAMAGLMLAVATAMWSVPATAQNAAATYKAKYVNDQ